jgi:hypothetical protein
MSTLIPFNPQQNANFQFSPFLDGRTYNAVCPWNAYSCRYYVNIYDTLGSLRLSLPLIASPDNGNINLTKGYFNTPIVFRASSNNFEIG